MRNINKLTLVALIIVSLLVGAFIGARFTPTSQTNNAMATSSENEPLYWVAPMDPNFRKDKPGKSPMGMDLIPVYAEDNNSTDESGRIYIEPHVVNNLGVRTSEVKKQSLKAEIETLGYVKYDEDQLLHIHPRVDGWIENLYVKAAGNPVKQGTPLYTLYSPQLVNAQEELLIALRRGSQSLIAAAKERLKALQLSDSFISQLIESKQVQQNITFYSPITGVLSRLKIREGFYVKPGNTLMSIAKLEQVWVEAEIYERDVARVSQGLPVQMQLDYLPGRTWHGVVDYVYPTLDETTRTLRVRLKFANLDKVLKPNMFAQIQIFPEQTKATMLVPAEAVIRTGNQDRVVLSYGKGEFKSVEVKLGRITNREVEILSGLEEGDQVVTSAQFLIDSESSKTSDFVRFSKLADTTTVWMQGLIEDTYSGQDRLSISHDAVEEWQWPAMTMDFSLADTIDTKSLKVGQVIHFEVIKTPKDDYLVNTIHIVEQPSFPSANVKGVIKTIDLDRRAVTIARDAIEKWQRPAATMEFLIDPGVDVSWLLIELNVEFTFEVREDLYIVDIQRVNSSADKQQHNHGDRS